MIRSQFLIALCLILPVPLATAADDWTAAAFPVVKHDFGTVAVAAKTEFEFPIHNPFDSPLHIRSVRASCGCTTPILKSEYIEPGQTGALTARFNTDTFRGKRGATLTVVVDRPHYNEVRLRVDGYIRSDMVFHPGAIEFGGINQAERVTNTSKVLYAGRQDWKIVDVQSNRPWLMPAVTEVNRGAGRVNYEIAVTVREDAPVGFFQDEISVLTNDRSMPSVPLRVSGEVKSPLTISPQAIALGSIKPGETVRQKMILICRDPFEIESIKAEGWDVQFEPSEQAKKTQVVFAEFTPLEGQSGPQKCTIVIEAKGEESLTAKALLTAEVRDR